MEVTSNDAKQDAIVNMISLSLDKSSPFNADKVLTFANVAINHYNEHEIMNPVITFRDNCYLFRAPSKTQTTASSYWSIW